MCGAMPPELEQCPVVQRCKRVRYCADDTANFKNPNHMHTTATSAPVWRIAAIPVFKFIVSSMAPSLNACPPDASCTEANTSRSNKRRESMPRLIGDISSALKFLSTQTNHYQFDIWKVESACIPRNSWRSSSKPCRSAASQPPCCVDPCDEYLINRVA